MSRKIFVESSEIDSILSELKKSLEGKRCFGSLSVKKPLVADKKEANLYFTPTAWLKMTLLTSEFTTEVQWHGLVKRIAEDTFEVYDILVFPHSVTGVTVTSDQEEYTKWLDSLDDDSFNALRFHGHSHVNMPVNPSSVDMEYRHNLVTQLPNPTESNDVFYIFMIINKSHKWSAEIYDITNNAMYSTDSKDISMYVWFDDYETIDTFVEGAKKIVRTERTYSSQHNSGTSNVKGSEKKQNDSSDAVIYVQGVYYCGVCGKEFKSWEGAKKCNHVDPDDYYDPYYERGAYYS